MCTMQNMLLPTPHSACVQAEGIVKERNRQQTEWEIHTHKQAASLQQPILPVTPTGQANKTREGGKGWH